MKSVPLKARIFSVTTFLIIAFSTVPVHAEKYLFEAGIGFGVLNYYVDTMAGSLLKWRDSLFFQQHITLERRFSKHFFGSICFEHYMLSGGEMTDDDLNNLYGTEYGVYSTTRMMRGNGYKLHIDGAYRFFESGRTTFSGTGGFFLHAFTIRPKGILQAAILPEDSYTYYDDREVQHTEIDYLGFQLGSKILHKATDSIEILFDLALLLPFHHESRQYYWGYGAPDYDWKLEQKSLFKTFGVHITAGNRFRLTDHLWLSLQGWYSFMKSSDQTETDWYENSYAAAGKAHSSILSNAGAGISLRYH